MFVYFDLVKVKFCGLNAVMFIQEGDYVVIKKDANMKVLQVTPNRYLLL